MLDINLSRINQPAIVLCKKKVRKPIAPPSVTSYFKLGAWQGFALVLCMEVFRWIRHCAICGESGDSVHWLCPACDQWMLEKAQKKTQWLSKDICHHYLFDWYPADTQMASLVYSIKGPGRADVIKALATYFGKARGKAVIFYPSAGPVDHAHHLAWALAELWKTQAEALYKANSQKQSRLSQRLRRRREFLSPAQQPTGQVYLADDIVTSGGTVHGCRRALGQPKKMTVWSLFYRHFL